MTRLLRAFIFVCFALAFSNARADYRVFTLKIEDSTTGQSRTVNTTLDHLQYASYYPVRTNETVSIADTWMCRNYRSDVSQDINQRYCPNPRSPRAPASAPAAH